MDLSLYVHIPFCERKCFYCDFTSYVNKDDKIGEYIQSLIRELSLYKKELQKYNIKTIFIGGGTPSSIESNYIKTILEYIYDNFNVDKSNEITIEVNPGTLTMEKAQTYKEAGINRISLGLQTINNNMLKAIGRIHRVEDFYRSYDILKEVGFSNINVDLIFGLPDQKLQDVLNDVVIVKNLGIEHISYYSLILEPETKMYKLEEEGKLNLPNEKEERRMYHEIIKLLKQNGYIHYEISNFAKTGYQCKHNKTYWEAKPYLGVGVSSHSNMDNKRFWNTENLDEYLEKLRNGILPIVGKEIIDKEMEMAEYCILGIRLIKGIDKLEFKKRFGKDIEAIYGDIILKHVKNGLLKEEKDNLCLTTRGLDLANLVEVDFLPQK